MNCLKLIFTDNDSYYDEEDFISCKTINQLNKYQRENLIYLVLQSFTDKQKVELLENLNISENEMHSFVKTLGYDLITRIKKIPELEIEDPENLYYSGTNHIKAFSPSKKEDYKYKDAVNYQGPFFVQVKVPDSHPFSQAQKQFQSKNEKIKQEKAEKKKLKDIEKAKKLLEENQVLTTGKSVVM